MTNCLPMPCPSANFVLCIYFGSYQCHDANLLLYNDIEPNFHRWIHAMMTRVPFSKYIYYNDILTHFLYLIGVIWTKNVIFQKFICPCQYISHDTRHVAYNLKL